MVGVVRNGGEGRAARRTGVVRRVMVGKGLWFGMAVLPEKMWTGWKMVEIAGNE